MMRPISTHFAHSRKARGNEGEKVRETAVIQTKLHNGKLSGERGMVSSRRESARPNQTAIVNSSSSWPLSSGNPVPKLASHAPNGPIKRASPRPNRGSMTMRMKTAVNPIAPATVTKGNRATITPASNARRNGRGENVMGNRRLLTRWGNCQLLIVNYQLSTSPPR